MPRYRVFVTNVVSTVVEVEAGSPDEAVEFAFDSPDMPGSITIGAFGQTSVDAGEWEPKIVMDEAGTEVWKDE